MCHRAGLHLPAAGDSAPRTRWFVADRLADWGVDGDDVACQVRDDVALVATELAANAARFSAAGFDVRLVAHHDHVELAVTDQAPGEPSPQHPAATATGGRGLAIVATLAAEWGVRAETRGKTVWCRLVVPAGSALERGCVIRTAVSAASGRS